MKKLLFVLFFCCCIEAVKSQDTIPPETYECFLKDTYGVMDVANKYNWEFDDAGDNIIPEFKGIYGMTFFRTDKKGEVTMLMFLFDKGSCMWFKIFEKGNAQGDYERNKTYLEKHGYKKDGGRWKAGLLSAWMVFDQMESGESILVTTISLL